MFRQLGTGIVLGLLVASPIWAETFTSPDSNWWESFTDTIDGKTPDLKTIAETDQKYLEADEFTRDKVLEDLIAKLQAEQQTVDPKTAKIVMNINAKIEDYSRDENGFPVSIFTQSTYMNVGTASKSISLFFRNWQDFRILPASLDEAKALRSKLGGENVVVEITLSAVRSSKSRTRAYDAHVDEVTYFTPKGSILAKFSAPEKVQLSPDDAAIKLAQARTKLLSAAGIPPLGTSWTDAKAQLPALWPIIASDDYNSGGGLAYVWKDGAVLNDFPHTQGKGFKVFLQQVDGEWVPKSGHSININDLVYRNDSNSLDVSVTGPGLACYTPDTLDRCAVLQFKPEGDGFVLSAAYGVIEMANAATPEIGFKTFFGDAAAVFDVFETTVFYDRQEMQTGIKSNRVSVEAGGGQPIYVAGAGLDTTGKPFYDPLKITRDINPVSREMAIYTIGSAPDRMPLLYVLQN